MRRGQPGAQRRGSRGWSSGRGRGEAVPSPSVIDLGVRTRWLYVAIRIEAEIGRPDGSSAHRAGNGFVLRCDDGRLVLVTCRHVVDPAWTRSIGEQLVSVRLQGFSQTDDAAPTVPFELMATQPVVVGSTNTAADVALLPMETFAHSGPPVTLEPVVDQHLLAADAEFGVDIAAGDFFAAPGYISLPDTSTERPVFMTGVIASDPREPLIISSSNAGEAAERAVVLYQALSRGGLSGAPVIATQRGLNFGDGLSGPSHRPMRVVGVNAGHYQRAGLPLGLSYFVRSGEVLRALEESILISGS